MITATLLCASLTLAVHEGHEGHGDAKGVQRPRLETSRPVHLDLPLPEEEDAFFFVVYGDRTGGPAEGIRVLEDAVRDTRLIDPDFVMTVGDLIQGYNETPEWLVQMDEFKRVMNVLDCPWFPVAGNHDIYWRGPEGSAPLGEHESNYETHFGPLWYAFRHKGSSFIVLYSDEGDPESLEKTFRKPECQRMSEEQLAWLDATLERHRDSQHVFVFLHHPRWLNPQNYGHDWQRVHERLAANGNVRAVFAGHIHHMTYEGPFDGIEYFTLATVGGHASGDVERAGQLHQYHVVTVRPDKLAVTAYPVGSALDPRRITERVAKDTFRLRRELRPAFEGRVSIREGLSARGELACTITNPVGNPIHVTVEPAPGDPRWTMALKTEPLRLEPYGSAKLAFTVARPEGPLDAAFELPQLRVSSGYECDDGHVIPFPEKLVELPLDVSELPLEDADTDAALVVDGRSGYLRVDSADVDLPDGPFTLEGWLRAEAFSRGMAFVTKTESSEYGLFVNEGRPSFTVHLDGAYKGPRTEEPLLEPGRWYHLAGVFDGEETRLYVDGELVGREPASGTRTRSELPLLIGADVNASGRGGRYFHGAIDEVRLSSRARYTGERFTPASRLSADESTLLLLHMDGRLGPWMVDGTGRRKHPRLFGETDCRARSSFDRSPVPTGAPSGAR